jgi:hypothetical protein
VVAVDVGAGHIPPIEEFLYPPDVLVSRKGLDHSVKGFKAAGEQDQEHSEIDSLLRVEHPGEADEEKGVNREPDDGHSNRLRIRRKRMPDPAWACGGDHHGSRQRLLSHHPSLRRKKSQEGWGQGNELKEKKEEEKKKGKVKGSGEELKAVGFGYGVPGRLFQQEEGTADQDSEGDKSVCVVTNPTKEEMGGAKNKEIYDKSGFFQKTGALSEACAIQVLPLQKGEMEGIFFN